MITKIVEDFLVIFVYYLQINNDLHNQVETKLIFFF